MLFALSIEPQSLSGIVLELPTLFENNSSELRTAINFVFASGVEHSGEDETHSVPTMSWIFRSNSASWS